MTNIRKSIVILLAIVLLAILTISLIINKNDNVTIYQQTNTPIIKQVYQIPTLPLSRVTKDPALEYPILTSATPMPTLSLEKQEQFYKIVKNNNNCSLPCFWGIIPGKTTIYDAKTLFVKMIDQTIQEIGQSEFIERGKVYSIHIQTKTERWLDIYLKFHVDTNDIIQVIEYKTDTYKGSSYVGDDIHLTYYSIENFLKLLGPPDYIYIESEFHAFYIIEYYPKISMAVEYLGNEMYDSKNIDSVCPIIGDGDISGIWLELSSPASQIDLSKHMPLLGIFNTSNTSFINTLGISSTNFIDHLGSGKSRCFKLISD
jgi:hypothetical protein